MSPSSPVKGHNLYTHIHEKNTVFDMHSKLSIITQIAQVRKISANHYRIIAIDQNITT